MSKFLKFFKKVGHWVKKHKLITGAIIGVGAMLIPGGSMVAGRALSKIGIGNALKLGAIGGAGYATYKASGKIGHVMKSPLFIASGVGIGGLLLYNKMKK